jgi:acyl carrier protein
MSDRFIEDLGAESLDLVNLAVVIEEQTGIFVAVEAVPELNTVQDFYDYLLSISSL